MTNFGQPYIVVEDGDYRRGRELYLRHCHEGDDLDLEYADKTLKYIHQLWSRPVHLETVVEGKKTVLSYEGQHGRVSASSGSSQAPDDGAGVTLREWWGYNGKPRHVVHRRRAS